MGIYIWMKKHLQGIVDGFYAKWPQPVPDKKKLEHCKIISHRGEHDNEVVFENTTAAFDRAKHAGVWGIEFDIRWTKDLLPIVFHDDSLRRVFQSDVKISQTNMADLKMHCQLIPSLEEVVEKYGKTMHLMAEIKESMHMNSSRKGKVLKDIFKRLSPQEDFHFLSLLPDIFEDIDFVPKSALLLSAQFNIKTLSNQALKENYGGIAGHYLLLTDNLLKKHQGKGQRVGTGYIGSRNCLIRELNRGVTWIFSNNAVELQKICQSFSGI